MVLHGTVPKGAVRPNAQPFITGNSDACGRRREQGDGLAPFDHPAKRTRETVGERRENCIYSTVTLFARFLGWSTSQPRRTAMW